MAKEKDSFVTRLNGVLTSSLYVARAVSFRSIRDVAVCWSVAIYSYSMSLFLSSVFYYLVSLSSLNCLRAAEAHLRASSFNESYNYVCHSSCIDVF